MKVHELKLEEKVFTPLARGATHHLFLQPKKAVDVGHVLVVSEYDDDGQKTGRERLFWVTNVSDVEEPALKPGYVTVGVLMARKPRSI